MVVSDETSTSLMTWLRQNGPLIIATATQAIFLTIWLTRLDARIYTMEQRGSPHLEKLAGDITRIDARLTEHEARQNLTDHRLDRIDDLANRLLLVEERQRNVLESLARNGTKLDAALELLRNSQSPK